MFDVRFLPNPYFDDKLRPLDGRSEEVQAFLDDVPETAPFLQHLTGLLDFLIPLYSAEGKSYLTIGIGCTGGKHRSVGLTLRVAEHLSKTEWRSNVHHRDLGKE